MDIKMLCVATIYKPTKIKRPHTSTSPRSFRSDNTKDQHPVSFTIAAWVYEDVVVSLILWPQRKQNYTCTELASFCLVKRFTNASSLPFLFLCFQAFALCLWNIHICGLFVWWSKVVETHRRAQAVTQGAAEQLTLEEFACLRWARGLGDGLWMSVLCQPVCVRMTVYFTAGLGYNKLCSAALL